jgi:molybdopterin/thiamine biosynthesis adenylyltransferase
MRIIAQIPSYGKFEFEIGKEKVKVSFLKKLICEKIGIEPELTDLIIDKVKLNSNDTITSTSLKDKIITIDYLWARQILLWGFDGQRKIRDSKILMVGAGALGNEVAKNLLMFGIGTLYIVDYDFIEKSNLNRMIFFSNKDVGKLKADVLAGRLKRRFPYANIVAFNRKVEELPPSIFLKSDVIVSCLDNFEARLYLSKISKRYSIPLVDGGLKGSQGRVQVIYRENDPCLACIIPLSNMKEALQLRNPCSPPIEEVKIPSIPSINSLVASIISHEVVKIILNKIGEKYPVIDKPIIIDLDAGRFSQLELRRNPECIVCRNEKKVEVVRLKAKSLKEVIDKLGLNSNGLFLYRVDEEIRKVDSDELNPGFYQAVYLENGIYKEKIVEII